jgi:pimeloyl-ACP methyl ester carboxylesterase
MPSSENSTNVRIRVLRLGLGAMGSVAPGLAAHVAAHMFMTPPRHKTPPREADVARAGTPFAIAAGRARLSARRYGEGPVVVLVHGWGGRGSQLHSFVEPLVALGFSVVTFDAPAHGASSGRTSSLPGFARALRAVVGAVGPIHGVVAHSMGAAAVMLALHDGIDIPRAVFVAPPSSALEFFRRFSAYVRLPDAVARRAKRAIERRARRRLADLEASFLAPDRASATPLIVFHDEDDRDVPLTSGEAVVEAWPGAELVRTKGLGHRRILRDPAVVTEAVRFLARGERGPCRCAQCELERELYDPALRRSRYFAA